MEGTTDVTQSLIGPGDVSLGPVAAGSSQKFSRIVIDMRMPCAAYSGMNVHHLELFYYVAKHGGISEAVRKMPYGIQQSAISSQILQLEETLGLKLFQRRPFNLTPA